MLYIYMYVCMSVFTCTHDLYNLLQVLDRPLKKAYLRHNQSATDIKKVCTYIYIYSYMYNNILNKCASKTIVSHGVHFINYLELEARGRCGY